jgi:hypothetical protein
MSVGGFQVFSTDLELNRLAQECSVISERERLAVKSLTISVQVMRYSTRYRIG